MRKLNAVTAALLATTMFATPVFAQQRQQQPDPTARQIQALEEQLRSLQQQLNTMKAEQDRTKAQHDAEMKEKMAAEAEAREAQLQAGAKIVFQDGKQKLLPAPPGPKVVEPANHRFQLSSGDGAWTIAPTGRVHFDIGAYLNQSPETANTFGIGDNKLGSGVNVRRGRFGVTGKAMTDFTYTIILDGGGTSDSTNSTGGVFGGAVNSIINTAQLSYTGYRNTSIDFGYFAQYAFMDEAMSSNDILFMERATPTVAASSFGAGDPRFGAGFRTWEPNWFLAAYITGTQPGAAHATAFKAWNAFVRASYQVIAKDAATLHVGGTVMSTLQVPNNGVGTARTLTFSDRPEIRIDPTNSATTIGINTGATGATVATQVTSSQVYGAEVAATYGAWFFQGEYYAYVVNRVARPKLNFEGAYLEASYAWGGRRTYNVNCGCYGGINPINPFSPRTGGMGAFEIAARISYADFVDQFNSSRTTVSQALLNPINGGRQTNFTLALNWFLNSNMMFKFNYIHSNLDKANASTNGIAPGTPSGIEMDAVAARVQFVF